MKVKKECMRRLYFERLIIYIEREVVGIFRRKKDGVVEGLYLWDRGFRYRMRRLSIWL